MEQKNLETGSEEINLIEIIQKIWDSRKNLIKFSVLFSFLGVFLALNSPNVYTATATFIPKGKSGGSGGGSLSSLASLAGISLGGMSNSSEIPPSLYPMLIKSNPFIDKLLNSKVPKEGAMIRLEDYLSDTVGTSGILATIKKYSIGVHSMIINRLFSEKTEPVILNDFENIRKLTLEEENIYKIAKNFINLTIDKKEGFVTISAESKNPEVAAFITQNAQNLLQQEVIDFQIKNAQELLTFTEGLYAEKKVAFEALQDELASFRDQHQNISSGLFENKLSRLVSELAIASAVNEELAKQVEQARIQVSKDTPIFTVIDPVVIPNQRTSPKRKMIVLGYTFLGFFLGLGYALIKEPFVKIRKQILEGGDKI